MPGTAGSALDEGTFIDNVKRSLYKPKIDYFFLFSCFFQINVKIKKKMLQKCFYPEAYCTQCSFKVHVVGIVCLSDPQPYRTRCSNVSIVLEKVCPKKKKIS